MHHMSIDLGKEAWHQRLNVPAGARQCGLAHVLSLMPLEDYAHDAGPRTGLAADSCAIRHPSTTEKSR